MYEKIKKMFQSQSTQQKEKLFNKILCVSDVMNFEKHFVSPGTESQANMHH